MIGGGFVAKASARLPMADDIFRELFRANTVSYKVWQAEELTGQDCSGTLVLFIFIISLLRTSRRNAVKQNLRLFVGTCKSKSSPNQKGMLCRSEHLVLAPHLLISCKIQLVSRAFDRQCMLPATANCRGPLFDPEGASFAATAANCCSCS